MTINSVSNVQSTPFTGLATQTYNVLTTGNYVVGISCTIPYVASGSSDTSTTAASDPNASALQILVKLNGTTKLTLNNPSPTQPSLSGQVSIACTAGDVITVVPSSTAAVDSQPNAVKGVINIYQGVG